MTYCNGSFQSREDVFEFLIVAESASNLLLELGGALTEPRCAVTRTNEGASHCEKTLTAAFHRVFVCVCMKHQSLCILSFKKSVFLKIQLIG